MSPEQPSDQSPLEDLTKDQFDTFLSHALKDPEFKMIGVEGYSKVREYVQRARRIRERGENTGVLKGSEGSYVVETDGNEDGEPGVEIKFGNIAEVREWVEKYGGQVRDVDGKVLHEVKIPEEPSK